MTYVDVQKCVYYTYLPETEKKIYLNIIMEMGQVESFAQLFISGRAQEQKNNITKLKFSVSLGGCYFSEIETQVLLLLFTDSGQVLVKLLTIIYFPTKVTDPRAGRRQAIFNLKQIPGT